MSTGALQDLIDRLEKAEEGSRVLDWSVADAAGFTVVSRPEDGSAFVIQLSDTEFTRVPDYTTSVDGALSLVPEGRLWSIGTIINKTGYVACLDNQGKSWRGATPALALCIACLRARA